MSSISEFFRMFKDSLCREKLTNLGVKGAKRSVKMWTTNIYNSFSKNSLWYMSSRLPKTRSVHTYVMPRTVYFGGICILYLGRFFYWFCSEAINKRLVNFGCYWHFSSHMPCFSPLATIIDHKPRAGTKTLL